MDKEIKSICLMGSTKFKKEHEEIAKDLNLMGIDVYMTHVFSHADNITLSDTELENLKKVALERIEKADVVMCISPDGYMGEGTREELEYAVKCGKKVIMVSGRFKPDFGDTMIKLKKVTEGVV